MSALWNCPECGNHTDFRDMVKTDGKLCYHNFVCVRCYVNLENDDENEGE